MTKSNSPNFSIVIPNFNGAKFIEPCLVTLHKAILSCPKSKFEIILVDNGSTDNSPEIFKKFFPENSKLIALRSNFGFAKAVNDGIRTSKYDYVCVLNNDLNLNPDWFSLISKAITENPKYSTFCGTVLSYDGSKIESQGFKYFMSGRCENINNGQPYKSSLRESLPRAKSRGDNLKAPYIPVWGSSAAVVVYQKSAIETVGLFDESFFAYIEDVDLAFRLSKNNYQSLLIPTAISYHLGGSTSNNMGTLRQYYTLRNWIKLIIKNYSISQILTNLPSIMIERLRNLSYLIRSSLIINK
ncbi:MAG: glycosyltransferase family 2 protein [Candidatus Shapirobacteria bacterium]